MEFEELQKIWDSQKDEPLYAINAKALHNRILSKMERAGHVSNTSELLLILTNIGAGSLILWMSPYGQNGNIFMYLMAGWMFFTALYVVYGRINRVRGEHQFDRSMLGDLNHAISIATYQVRLSQLMRWNILPIGLLSLLGLWGSGKPFWILILVLLFFALAYFAGDWEHNIYKVRKRELESLLKKLESEDIVDSQS